eukprot:m.524910 g.524910  ORF g.524910 m.524910 type:complete len:161 (+) comp57534_c1_seq6:438-920(+)
MIVRPSTASSPLPVIAFPHGGPHSAFAVEYLLSVATFARFGFAVVLINFRGSIGFGQGSIHSLPGKVGELDVADVNTAIDLALTANPTEFDPAKVVVFGGSHGGLLGAHLTGQHPDRYKVAVLRNPVVDIVTMVGSVSWEAFFGSRGLEVEDLDWFAFFS